jgi:(p)ppGpp synthase/HD superfamily hydrolase
MPARHLWQSAAAFAARAHLHQVRKDGVTPYFSHPVRVAMIVANVFGFDDDEETLAAALLHDAIEDTAADYDDLHMHFGSRVADIVAALTKDMRLIERRREEAYDAQLAAGPWEARLIKLADVYDNLCDMTIDKSRRKQIARAKRAIKLATGDKQLAAPQKMVENLIKACGRVGHRR